MKNNFIKILLLFSLFYCNLSNTFAVLNYKNTDNKNLFFKTDQNIKIKLQVSQSDIKTFNKATTLLSQDNWSEALSWADSIKSENLKDSLVEYVLWKKYTNLNIKFADTEFNNLLDFIKSHQYLPNINDLKNKAEIMFLNNNIPYEFAENYFNIIKPLNPKTIIKILREKVKNSQNIKNNQLNNEIIEAFNNYNFDNNELLNFITYFKSYLSESDYAKKVENILWSKQYSKANLIIGKLNKPNRILYSAIIEINKNPKYINNILRSVPASLRENELLLYTRFIYKHKHNNSKDALKILLSLKSKTEKSSIWWKYQKYYSRELLKDKDYSKAYFLVINNNLDKNTSDYAESEWLAGWIALTFLNKPKDSYYHFFNMYNSVSFPISKSRGAYWAGRSMEANNNKNEAIKWYDIASKYPIYFYGQLSFHAKNQLLGITSLTEKYPLPLPPKFTTEEENRALNSNIVKIAYLMAKSNDNKKDYTALFTIAINQAQSKGEMSAILEIIKNTENEALIMKMAKYLTYKDIYFIDNLFPILNIINLENPNSHLIHSIIKQESGFHVSAESRVGATGFMQLMPFTAKEVAKKMNLRYNEKSLKTNPAYNILLGSYYINSLIKQFNGSQVLAIASYNAGSKPVNRWIKDFGDPRSMDTIKDIVNWIELIGYSETRNYVQRIIESSIVYEYILDRSSSIIKKMVIEENANNK